MVSITVTEVEEVYGENTPNVPDKQALVTIAERFTDQVKSGRISTLSEIEGDEKDFTKYVAAFLWNQTAGRSLNEDFQTGNAEPRDVPRIVNGDALAGDPMGNVALMIAGGQRGSISVIRADY